MKSQNFPESDSKVRRHTYLSDATCKKVDVLLVQPPIQDFYLTSKRTVPYGLVCIAAVLRQAGLKVALLDALATSKSRHLKLPKKMSYLRSFYPFKDLTPFGLFHQYRHFGYSYEHIGKVAKSADPDLVGISSLFTPYASQALETAMVIRKQLPHCKIVLGGHHPTAMPLEVMSHSAVDFVIRGEGEFALLELAYALKKKGDFKDILGLVYRASNNTVQCSAPRINPNLNQLPIPAHDLVKNKYYRRSKNGALTIITSRGCPMSCSYCSVGAKSYLTYRRRSKKQILAEIDFAARLGPVDFIDFEDENLTFDKTWFLSLLADIQKRWKGKMIELRAMNGLFPPSLDQKTIAAMKASGFRTLNLSLGATNAVQLKRFRRADVRPAFDRVLNVAKLHDLKCVGYIIAGAPYQNALDSVKDLLYLAQRRVLIGVSIFYPAPGSRDYVLCSDLNILPHQYGLMRSTALPIAHTTSRIEAATLLRLGRILNFIKQLIDYGIPLPEPSSPKVDIDVNQNRLQLGLHLLSWFFKDGYIRGVMPSGKVYSHRTALTLTQYFNNELIQLNLKGTT
ncbi:MAG: radical SAM protein [Desulfobacteraceae bacterium]|jgi:radical SAM superfamily enzyme YgiQ (UPF0313 family)